MTDTPIIEFNDFSFQYFSQAEPTLHGINLKIHPGEKVLIIGPSGSGKSTLGHCLNGLIPFYYKGEMHGSLKIKGQETAALDIFSLSKLVGTVLQDSDGQFVGLSVGEDIAFAMENDRVPRAEMLERVARVSKMVDMDRFLSSSPFELSGGQKQRTALAGVMIDDVDILLFDEPLANLDPATGKTAIEIIDDIHRDTGKTVIIIEHRLEDVLHRPVDRILLINEGRILADLDPHQMVSSDLLRQNGIREPLYVTALKYAGIPVTPDLRPGHLDTLDIPRVAERVKKWYLDSKASPPKMLEEAALELNDVSFSYDGLLKVVAGININVQRGEMLAVVGRNGAGKSTLAKLLCGFIHEDTGTISFEGTSLAKQSIKERAEVIGYVMQNPNQMISKALIFDEVALGLRLRGLAEEEIKTRVEKALKVCGLLPFITWPISALSYGQKKRVTIASILVLDPRVIILDEPTAGQDFRHYTDIMRFLREINRMGVTILLVTHDMHLMLEYTPRAIVLSDGKMVADARAADVLTDLDVITQANLKETSLYHLAQKAGLPDATSFVQRFIDYENTAVRI
jgi:energy-coupling factor transport system ATP-binding protein